MKIKDLLHAISKMNPETDIYIQGYEDGLEDLENIETCGVVRDLNDTESFWWVGPHDYDRGGKPSLVITRQNRTSSSLK
jgi:hypothetical protein